jgi:hypothetical protein
VHVQDHITVPGLAMEGKLERFASMLPWQRV